ncbi:MAG: ribonuclease III [Dorea sp.]|nr:ribonuclease III [Dorea sp.]
MNRELKELEEKIEYQFQDFLLLKKAMVHSSYANEMHLPKYQCNERLEFLGDAVLELISSEFLFFDESRMQEGDLTKLRASMVCEPTLAFCARQLRLGEYLLLGKGEEATGGRKRDSVVSDALEALIGAVYIDGGFASAKEFIMKFVLNDLDNRKLFYDSKTILQETVQANFKGGVQYRLIDEEGPDHNKSFSSAAYIEDKQYGVGKGKTKKAAEQEAAYQSILMLREKNIK